jgi:hypothetical protein
MKNQRTRLARARLRRRRAKLDVKIVRRKRTIKTLGKKLKKENGMLSRLETRRGRLK